MLKFVPDDFKTRETFEKAVKKSLFALMHVSDQYKPQQIRKKIILENYWSY